MIDGRPIELQGEDYILPPISLSGLRRMGERHKLLGTLDPDAGDAFIDAMTYALQRNYPDMTRQFVDASVGVENASALFKSYVAINNLKAAEGEKKAGEIKG
jgi:hypothetical protein